MNTTHLVREKVTRYTSTLLSAVMTVPLLISCGGRPDQSNLPPVDDSGTRTTSYPAQQQARKKGLSTGQKVAILAGAAALYYLYDQHKNRQGTGAEGQYYRSKNGRIYYRDAQGRPHWVTPPSEGIQVPAEQAERYREYQGYNGRETGRDLNDIPGQRSSEPEPQSAF